MADRHSSRHGTRKSVKKPVAWLTAVVLVAVGAVAVGVASASSCDASLTVTLRTEFNQGRHLNNGKLVEGWDTIGDVSITACSLTAAQRAGSVSSVSSNTDAIDASFELSSSSLSDTTSTFSGTVRLRSLEDDNAAEETVTVTFYLGKDTANEVTLGSESYTTYDND